MYSLQKKESSVILYPYKYETRDIRSNIPRAKPEGTPEGKGVYLTVYPEVSPNTERVYFFF